MSDFIKSWEISRGRFDSAVLSLNQEQLNFRLFPGFLTAGEMAIHVAGVELWFSMQMLETEFPGYEKVIASATAGVVNDAEFPFTTDEITPELVADALAKAREVAGPILANPSPDLLAKEFKSALGPIINGEGGLARWAFHPAYHHGQVYWLTQAPGFPA